MSTPSFELFEGPKGTWFARGTVGERERKVPTHTKDRDAAAIIAADKFKRMSAASAGSRARWAQFRAERAGAPLPSSRQLAAPAAAAAAPPPPAPSTDEAIRAAEINARMRARAGMVDELEDDDTPAERPPERKPAPESEPEAERVERVEPDKVIDPGDVDTDRDDDGDELDEEGEDDPEARAFISGMIVEGTITGATRAGTKLAKADRWPIIGWKKTPKSPNDPDERCVELVRKNLGKKLDRMLAPKMKFSPGMAIAVGLVGIVASMQLGADDLEPAAAAPPAPRPEPPPPRPPPSDIDNDDAPATAPRLAVVKTNQPATGDASASGRFK